MNTTFDELTQSSIKYTLSKKSVLELITFHETRGESLRKLSEC